MLNATTEAEARAQADRIRGVLVETADHKLRVVLLREVTEADIERVGARIIYRAPDALPARVRLVRQEATGVVHCRKCGRKLTDPVSIAAAIGPVCAKKKEEEVKSDGT